MGFLSGALQELSTLPCTFLPELQRHKDTVRFAFARNGGPAISVKITDANLDSVLAENSILILDSERLASAGIVKDRQAMVQVRT